MSVTVPQPLHKVALAEGSFGQAAKSLAMHLLACGGPVAASPSPSPPCTLTEAVPGWEGQLVDPRAEPEVSSFALCIRLPRAVCKCACACVCKRPYFSMGGVCVCVRVCGRCRAVSRLSLQRVPSTNLERGCHGAATCKH
jgi:hypothetical protein